METAPSDQVWVEVRAYLEAYWIARRRWDQAPDLAQAGVLKGLEQISKFNPARSSVKTFLCNVGKRAGIDYLRKEATQERWKVRVFHAAHNLEEMRYLRRTPARKPDV